MKIKYCSVKVSTLLLDGTDTKLCHEHLSNHIFGIIRFDTLTLQYVLKHRHTILMQ